MPRSLNSSRFSASPQKNGLTHLEQTQGFSPIDFPPFYFSKKHLLAHPSPSLFFIFFTSCKPPITRSSSIFSPCPQHPELGVERPVMGFFHWRPPGPPEHRCSEPVGCPPPQRRALSYLCFLGTECSISRRFPCSSTFPKDLKK